MNPHILLQGTAESAQRWRRHYITYKPKSDKVQGGLHNGRKWNSGSVHGAGICWPNLRPRAEVRHPNPVAGQLIDSLQTDNIMLIACPRSTRIPCAPLPKDYLLKQLLCLDTVLGSFVHRNWLSSTSLRNMYDMQPPRWSLQRVLTAAISLPVPSPCQMSELFSPKILKTD